jgi:hypothetical protein
MGQEYKQVYYKKVNVKGKYGGERNVYLFKNYSRIDKGKWGLDFISAYKSKNGEDFIVESGAGITQEKMEKQIVNYLKKWVD